MIMNGPNPVAGPLEHDTGTALQAFEASLERNYSTTHDKKCQRFLSAVARRCSSPPGQQHILCRRASHPFRRAWVLEQPV